MIDPELLKLVLFGILLMLLPRFFVSFLRRMRLAQWLMRLIRHGR